MKELVIVGAGGFGREVAWLVEEINQKIPTWDIVGFVDDDKPVGHPINEYEIVGNTEWLMKQKMSVVIAIGNPALRRESIKKLSASKNLYPTLIHPSVILSNKVNIGEGTIICANSVLTVNINIGNYVIVNLSCTIGHDVEIEDFVTVFPNVSISGGVQIGECASVGTGASTIQYTKIHKNTIIGAGAVVATDIEKEGTYVGVPAMKIK
jgi:sugar O-acyltransferase (sialic acid O-acetyltransferase NeuD family)